MVAKVARTVLVVDDDATTLEVLHTVLDLEEFAVLTASDGQSALDIATSSAPDVIVLDVMMPGLDGYQVCRALKDDPRTSEIPVVLLTARDQPDDREQGTAAGCDLYLTKPFSPLTLITHLNDLQAAH